MVELITDYHAKHNSVPSNQQLVSFGKLEVRTDGKVLWYDAQTGKEEPISKRAFDSRRLGAIKAVFPDLVRRGRPKGS